jgi:tetratricopeptide (TPR) repeat protein
VREPVEILEVRYRNARAKGENAAAIKILKQIVLILPKDSNWRLKLAEDLLSAGKTVEARREFDEALEIEPEFLRAAVGIARTYASSGRESKAKIQLLKAARKGYPVARMMTERELKKCFNDCKFVLNLLEADKPEEVQVRDAFKNPLRRKPDG